MKVAVLLGGLSREREISLKTGRAVATALRSRGRSVAEIDMAADVAMQFLREKITHAFICLHGHFGEDGTIQGLLEIMKIPYTGSGPAASGLCMDKEWTKKILSASGMDSFRTPQWKIVSRKNAESVTMSPLPLPVIVKPNQEGSTIGMTIVRSNDQFLPALESALRHDGIALIEEFIEGTEITVAVLEGQTLPIVEIVPKSGFYDYTSKYTRGMTEYIVPARMDPKSANRVSKLSEEIFKVLRLSGVARMDYILEKKSGDPYFLEVNTIPGMTETSLVPKAAAAAGMSFEDLCEKILEGASLKVWEGLRKV